MKKGILQRCSKNWEETTSMAPPAHLQAVKTEPIADYDLVDEATTMAAVVAPSPPPPTLVFKMEPQQVMETGESINNITAAAAIIDNGEQNHQPTQRRSAEQQAQRRTQRESMISIRKDYSYKYSNSTAVSPPPPPPTTVVQKGFKLPPPPSPSSPFTVSSTSIVAAAKLRRDSVFLKRNHAESLSSSPSSPAAVKSSPISILERYDYDKSKVHFDDKFAKIDNNCSSTPAAANFPVSESAISSSSSRTMAMPAAATTAAVKSKSPPTTSPVAKKKKKKEKKKTTTSAKETTPAEPEQVKVIVKTEPIDVKPPPLLPPPASSPQPPPSENINKINNKINIIFQLNNDRSSKNIIWHSHRSRAPKKMVQKITIKEANNNNTTSTKMDINSGSASSNSSSVETQTEATTSSVKLNLSSSNPLADEPVEFMFFEDDVLLCLQRHTITFFEFNRLATLLRKGEPDFKLLDSIPRRLHDHPIDADNKFQRLCYNEQNPFPIYVEMRAKQKSLDHPELMAPIAFSYCNVYYIDPEGAAKFSSVHLDTVKCTHGDIVYTCIPGTSYFCMAWNEASPETKSTVTGIVKYKLTPNLDLAKLASIRQFPKLNYRTKQVYCGQASQLITFGDTQVSIFNYESGDLLMSLDLMKSYGTNLTTVAFRENYLFMVYLADEDVTTATNEPSKRVIVIGVNKCAREGNTFKVVHSTPVRKLKRCDRIVSKSITATNHLLITFAGGHVLMIHLNNFCDIHLHHGSPPTTVASIDESIFASSAHLLQARAQNIGLRSFAEFFFADAARS